MPSTALGFRYPAASDAPNVPQYIQNLASDIDAAFAARRWVTGYDGPDTYNYTLTNAYVALPSMTSFGVSVPAGRQLDVDVSLPSLELSVGGAIKVRLIIDEVVQDSNIVLTSAAGSGNARLTGHLTATTTRTIGFRVDGLKVGSGTYTVGGFDGAGPRVRYRLL